MAGAIVETRHQWQELAAALEAKYGAEKASLMACALTHDDPMSDCQGPNWTAIALVVTGVLIGLLVIGILLFRLRRRRRGHRAAPAQ